MDTIKKILVFLFVSAFSFVFVSNVFAQDSESDEVLNLESKEILSFKEIDELIKETKYTQALQRLSESLRKYPDALDAIQKRIDIIMKARAYYAQLANELITVMEKEPENAEKKLDIIAKLEALERNPTEEHLAFIKQAKIAAQFTYYKAKFQRIMNDASSCAIGKNYTDAISLIKSGFPLYRDEFFESSTESVNNSIMMAINEINADTANYENSRMLWNNAYNDFIRAIQSGNYERTVRAWDVFQLQMKRFASVRNAVVQKGAFFENLYSQQKEEKPEVGEAAYLSFMSHFILGSAAIPDSGIIGAMDAEWNYMTENSKQELYEVVKSSLSEFIRNSSVERALKSGLGRESAYLQDGDKYANIALNVNGLYGLLSELSGDTQDSLCPRYKKSMEYIRSLIANTEPSLKNYHDFEIYNSELQILARTTKVPTDLNQETDDTNMLRINDLVSLIGDIKKTAYDNLHADWYDEGEEEKKVLSRLSQTRKDASLDWTEQKTFYEKINTLVFDQTSLSIGTIWKDFADYYAAKAKRIQVTYEGVMDTAAALFKGIDENTPLEFNPQNLAVGHYPQEAIRDVEKKQPFLEKDFDLVAKLQDNFDLSSQYQKQKQFDEISNAVAALKRHTEQGQEIVELSQAELLLAQSSREKADEYYNKAYDAYRRGDYESARENLLKAREYYNESLAHQESASLRAASDKKLSELGGLINEKQNKIIVNEVRKLKTKAKEAYYAGNFEEAENLLNRASTRWAITNIVEDEEIKRLKLLVQNALALKVGREIKPTAPLYPEMSQILSNAHQYYDRGEILISEGKRNEALGLLNESKKKLRELQLVYPLNQEAAILMLRIERLIDPEQFKEFFARRVETAQENIKIPALQQSAYSDLIDLAELQPDYPGLRGFIYQVEIDLGIRAKPVDQSGLRQSAELAQEAQQLYNSAGNNEEILRQALARLDQAIALNPGNENAIILKDRIQIAVGGKAAVVLSSTDEASYNKAIQELRNNNIMGAYTIVEQLLQKPENRRSTKILDLQKQIQARL